MKELAIAMLKERNLGNHRIKSQSWAVSVSGIEHFNLGKEVSFGNSEDREKKKMSHRHQIWTFDLVWCINCKHNLCRHL